MVWDNAGSSDACNVAIAMFELDASTPNVRAPSRARLSDNKPPPHPTSSTFKPSSTGSLVRRRSESDSGLKSSLDASSSLSRINCTLTGFILCKSPNSPLSSHHCDDRREKWDISSGLTDVAELSKRVWWMTLVARARELGRQFETLCNLIVVHESAFGKQDTHKLVLILLATDCV